MQAGAPTAAADGGAVGEAGGAEEDGPPVVDAPDGASSAGAGSAAPGRSLGGAAGRSGGSPHEGSATKAAHASAKIGVARRARTQGQSIRQSTEYSTRPHATRSSPDGTSPSA